MRNITEQPEVDYCKKKKNQEEQSSSGCPEKKLFPPQRAKGPIHPENVFGSIKGT